MGALGSKEDLGQIVAIYGFNGNNFPWREVENRSVYHTTGLIFEHDKKKYVMTVRSKLITCKNIVMYHSCFNAPIHDTGSEPVMRNNLIILFQSIEFNIIILGTQYKNELDISSSEIISGDYDPKMVIPSYDFSKNSFPIPTKKSQYHTFKMDLNLESSTVEYDVNIYDVKFVESLVYQRTYVPANYMYKFILKNKETDLLGICGGIIFHKKYKLIGIISISEKYDLYVIPTKTLWKIIHDFTTNLDGINQYNGFLTLPFEYKLDKNSVPKITSECTIMTPDGNTNLEKNDIIVSINNNTIVPKEDILTINDKDFNENIPLDIYLKINLNANQPVDLVINRDKIMMSIKSIGTTIKNEIFPLSVQPYFFPNDVIPFVNIRNVVIVQLTHELLDITLVNKINIKNSITTDFFKDNLPINFSHNIFIIIDCFDTILTKKYKLPQIVFSDKKQTLNCPIVTMIDNKKIVKFDDLLGIDLTNNNKLFMTIGPSTDDQYKILL